MSKPRNNPQRRVGKPLRLQGFDYSANSAYFVTLCVDGHRLLFEHPCAARMVQDVFSSVMYYYQPIQAPKYVVMPNHFHAILEIYEQTETKNSISDIVKSFKRESTKEYLKLIKWGFLQDFEGKLWQKSFHDRIIRNEQEYQMVWEYIDNNPLQWELDRYYQKRTETPK